MDVHHSTPEVHPSRGTSTTLEPCVLSGTSSTEPTATELTTILDTHTIRVRVRVRVTTLEPCALPRTPNAEPTTTEPTKDPRACFLSGTSSGGSELTAYTTSTEPTTAELTTCSTTSGTYGARHRAIELTAGTALSDGEDEDGGTDNDNSNV